MANYNLDFKESHNFTDQELGEAMGNKLPLCYASEVTKTVIVAAKPYERLLQISDSPDKWRPLSAQYNGLNKMGVFRLSDKFKRSPLRKQKLTSRPYFDVAMRGKGNLVEYRIIVREKAALKNMLLTRYNSTIAIANGAEEIDTEMVFKDPFYKNRLIFKRHGAIQVKPGTTATQLMKRINKKIDDINESCSIPASVNCRCELPKAKVNMTSPNCHCILLDPEGNPMAEGPATVESVGMETKVNTYEDIHGNKLSFPSAPAYTIKGSFTTRATKKPEPKPKKSPLERCIRVVDYTNGIGKVRLPDFHPAKINGKKSFLYLYELFGDPCFAGWAYADDKDGHWYTGNRFTKDGEPLTRNAKEDHTTQLVVRVLFIESRHFRDPAF